MNFTKYFKGFTFFWEGIKAAKKEMWVSIEVLLALTLILSFFIQIVEHAAQPNVYRHWYDSTIWAFMSYLGNPGKFAPGDPITLVGRTLWIVVSLIKLAIFAVPAGLVAKGFTEANAKDKRKKQLSDFFSRMSKSFRTKKNRMLERHLQEMGEQAPFEHFHYVPDYIAVSDMQVSQNMDLKDIMDTVYTCDQFRLRNQSSADVKGKEDDRMLVENVFINTPYGSCIDRGSSVTIVSPKSREKMGIGWFSFHLAKMAGFNYISKDIEVDKDDPDDYYDLDPIQVINGDECASTPEEKSKMDKKQKMRQLYFDDIEKFAKREGAWIIFMLRHRKNSKNSTDVHIIDSMAAKRIQEGNYPRSTVTDSSKYDDLYDALSSMGEKIGISTEKNYERFLHKDINIQNLDSFRATRANSFTLRISSDNINFNDNQMVIMFELAQCLADKLTSGIHLHERDSDDIKTRRFGYDTELYS